MHSCVMPGAVQSPDFRKLESEEDMSMLDRYISLVKTKSEELLSLSNIPVAENFNRVGKMQDRRYRNL